KNGITGPINLIAGVRGTTAVDSFENYSTDSFTLNINAGPQIGAVADQSTTLGVPINVTLTSSNAPSEGVIYSVVDATTLAAPTNVTVTINQATGQITLTPKAGFTGSEMLVARVRGANSAD